MRKEIKLLMPQITLKHFEILSNIEIELKQISLIETFSINGSFQQVKVQNVVTLHY